MGILGGFPVGGGRIAEGFQPQKYIPAFYSDSYGIPFRYELRNSSGGLVRVLPYAYGVQWVRKVNEADWLQLSYPGDDDGATEYMLYPYEIWVYEGDNTDPVQKFTIRTRTDSVAEAHTVTITGTSYLHQLLNEWVDAYTPASGATIGDVLDALMTTYQNDSNPIVSLYIHPEISAYPYENEFRSKSLLRCVLDMVEYRGGYIWIDTDRRLFWEFEQGVDHGHVIKVGRNALHFQLTRSYDEYVDRIIAYGYGLTEDSRLSVTVGDAGVVGKFEDRSITDLETLTRVAWAEWHRRRTPKTTYSIDMIDLSKVDRSDLDFSFEAEMFTPGSHVRILVSELDINIESTVLSVRRNLDRPMDVQVNFSNPSARFYRTWEVDGGGVTRDNDPGSSLPIDLGRIVAELWARTERPEEGLEEGIKDLFGMDGTDGLDGVAWHNSETGGGTFRTILNEVLSEAPASGDPDMQEVVTDLVVDALTDTEAVNHTEITNAVYNVHGDTIPLYTTDTELNLPEPSGIEEYSLAYTTTDGTWFQRNNSNTGWEQLNAEVDVETVLYWPSDYSDMVSNYTGISDGKLCYIASTGHLYYQHGDYSDFAGGFIRLGRTIIYDQWADLTDTSVVERDGDFAYINSVREYWGLYARIEGDWHKIGVTEVYDLPPIPEAGMKEVYWISSADNSTATGDGQIWRAYAGQDQYYPTQKFTSLSGIPASGA